jgi:hypothetical protein
MGDVMRESAEAALSYVRTNAEALGIAPDVFEKTKIHVHVPAGGTPKDGPSAGITMIVSLASLLSGKPVRGDLSMTGEITLRGQVLPVGGIKGKVLAAHRAGIKELILPSRNAKDLEEVPPEVLSAFRSPVINRWTRCAKRFPALADEWPAAPSGELTGIELIRLARNDRSAAKAVLAAMSTRRRLAPARSAARGAGRVPDARRAPEDIVPLLPEAELVQTVAPAACRKRLVVELAGRAAHRCV